MRNCTSDGTLLDEYTKFPEQDTCDCHERCPQCGKRKQPWPRRPGAYEYVPPRPYELPWYRVHC